MLPEVCELNPAYIYFHFQFYDSIRLVEGLSFYSTQG